MFAAEHEIFTADVPSCDASNALPACCVFVEWYIGHIEDIESAYVEQNFPHLIVQLSYSKLTF